MKDGARIVDSPNEPGSLVSPCDGKVIRIAEVDLDNYTIDPVKGIAYGLDEFLLGEKDDSKLKSMLQLAKERGNKVMFMIIYLCPGDYHRYHSPATFNA